MKNQQGSETPKEFEFGKLGAIIHDCENSEVRAMILSINCNFIHAARLNTVSGIGMLFRNPVLRKTDYEKENYSHAGYDGIPGRDGPVEQ